MPFDGRAYENRNEAVQKIEKVIDLLSPQNRWCKGALYRPGGHRCILGALQSVDAVIMLRGAVLQAIQEITGKHYQNIETFNDARSTTHSLVMQILIRARENLLQPNFIRPAPARPGWWSRLGSVFG